MPIQNTKFYPPNPHHFICLVPFFYSQFCVMAFLILLFKQDLSLFSSMIYAGRLPLTVEVERGLCRATSFPGCYARKTTRYKSWCNLLRYFINFKELIFVLTSLYTLRLKLKPNLKRRAYNIWIIYDCRHLI